MTKLTLSNNSTDYPTDYPTDYTTNLVTPIKLEVDKKYEAAFVSLHTYNSLPNITEDNNKFKYSNDKGKTWKIITFSKGAYEFFDINALIQREMQINGDNDKINDKCYIDIDYYKPTFKTILTISNEDYMIDFGIKNSIGSTLGFTKEKLLYGIHQ